jgi:hypothetical protein
MPGLPAGSAAGSLEGLPQRPGARPRGPYQESKSSPDRRHGVAAVPTQQHCIPSRRHGVNPAPPSEPLARGTGGFALPLSSAPSASTAVRAAADPDAADPWPVTGRRPCPSHVACPTGAAPACGSSPSGPIPERKGGTAVRHVTSDWTTRHGEIAAALRNNAIPKYLSTTTRHDVSARRCAGFGPEHFGSRRRG